MFVTPEIQADLPHQLKHYKLNFFEPIGHGSFGEVFKGLDEEKRVFVAMKKISWTVNDTDLDFDSKRELQMSIEIPRHKNIIHITDSICLTKTVWIVMEFCALGDLDSFLRGRVPTLKERVDLMDQASCGLEFLHSQSPPIVHRDLKLKNILLRTEGGQDVVKLTDFGSAKRLEETIMGTLCGTQTFWAPEILPSMGNVKYTKEVDVFSLGLVYLVMIMFRRGDKTLEPKIGKYM